MARSSRGKKKKKSYAIVGEGLTEKIYFDKLKKYENLASFQVKPDLPTNSNFQGILSKSDNLIDQGIDRVYAIIDLDKIIEDGKEAVLQNEIQARSSKIKNKTLKVIYCNPCFEIWFLLHYKEATNKSYRSGDGVIADLRNYINDYEKSEKYLNRNDIYSLLRPNLKKKGLPNSKKTQRVKNSGKRTSLSLVHIIIEDLKI